MRHKWLVAMFAGGCVLLGQQGCPRDADNDGWFACDAEDDPLGGTCDCDDSDDDTYPGAEEICYDGVDQNCDGVDLTDCPGIPVTAQPGEVIVTEVMHNTRLVLETEGQWFEITNVTEDKTFDLQGWTFFDGERGYTVPRDGEVLLAPGQVMTLGRNGDPEENGGVQIDYVYTDLYFVTGDGFRVAMSEEDGTPIDWVEFDFGPDGFPYVEGHALALSRDAYSAAANNDPANWCVSFEPIEGSSDYGTPGATNPVCDPDQDRDAYPTGIDCDDGDPAVNPGVAEVEGNGVDDDCDGEVDEAPEYPPGSVIITEIMYNPYMTADSVGEWFEVYNTTDEAINMQGWLVGDTIDTPDTHVIMDPLYLLPNDYLVFGVSDDPLENGGVEVDYVIPRFGFTNSYNAEAGYKDQIRVIHDNLLIDAVAYGDATFPDQRGHALNLTPEAFDFEANDIGYNWCLASTPMTDEVYVDYGTPGWANEVCPQDEDGDGYRKDVDCDDLDPEVHPGAVEQFNGKDDDCDGVIDEVAPAPGSVVISELMINPDASGDVYGEYIELHNPSFTGPLDVNGWTIRDSGGSSFTIDNGAPLVIEPLSYIVLVRSADQSLNGGVEADYSYGGALGLTNTTPDDVIVEYNGVVIDQVSYDPAGGWEIPEGASLVVSPMALSAEMNDNPANWCVSDTPIMPGGDAGTPGFGNDLCF